MPCRTILNGRDLDLASTGKCLCCSRPSPQDHLPQTGKAISCFWSCHLNVRMLSCPSPKSSLPRVGSQDNQSFLEDQVRHLLLGLPVLNCPAGAVPSGRCLEQKKFFSLMSGILGFIITQSGSEPVCLWWDAGDLDPCAFGV